MNSKIVQIFTGLLLSIFVLSLSIGGGMYMVGIIDLPWPDSDSDSEMDTAEVKLVNSTIDSSTISEKSLNSVVSVYTKQDNNITSQGSGFVYDDGYIMTNQHVINNSNELYVEYNNGDWSEATLVGDDRYTDIAILEPKSRPSSAKKLSLMTNDIPERGNPVIALGSPSSLEGTVTTGIISGTNRNMNSMTQYSIPDSIQTDAALNNGNSGGPLVLSETGEVVGINTATEGENLGFAVSSRLADTIGQSIISKGEHQHSYVGIRTTEINPVSETDYDLNVESGLIVEEVISESPNDGVLYSDEDQDSPDVIMGIDGQEIKTNEALTSYLLRNTTPGDTVELDIYRNGSTEKVTIELGSR